MTNSQHSELTSKTHFMYVACIPSRLIPYIIENECLKHLYTRTEIFLRKENFIHKSAIVSLVIKDFNDAIVK